MKKFLITFALLLSVFIALQGQTVITLTAFQPDELIVNAGYDKNISPGESVTLGYFPVVKGGTEPYSYIWSQGGAGVSTEENPVVSPLETTNYTLVVTDHQNCTATDHITLSVIQTGIDDFTKDELKIYPNPASDQFTVEYGGENLTVSLFNEQGKHLWTRPISEKTSFSTPHAPGLYLLKLNDRGKTCVNRIVVSK